MLSRSSCENESYPVPRSLWKSQAVEHQLVPDLPGIALQRPFSRPHARIRLSPRVSDSAAIAVKRRDPRQLPQKKDTLCHPL